VETPDTIDGIYDLVGIGFGPANLGLAIALEEHNAASDHADALCGLFLERQEKFGWQRGMLIDDARMQVSFLKDLVTLRNPGSDFGFLSYLQDRGRLVDFVNHQNFFPSRVEFHDYFEWAAARSRVPVAYGHEVLQVRPVTDERGVVALEVVCQSVGTEDQVVVAARNVVISAGLEPVVPDGVVTSDRIWHSNELLDRIEKLRAGDVRRFVVVGAGQSAAEVVAHLHRTFDNAEVWSVFTRYGYTPADDSPFVNRIFDPDAVQTYFAASATVKDMLMGYHRNTNYSAVDADLIDELYRRFYQEKVTGRQRLHVLNMSRVLASRDGGEGVSVTIESLRDNSVSELAADIVVYATGYRSVNPEGFLHEILPLCRRNTDGQLCVERDYRLSTLGDVGCGIYLQGSTERTHGLSSSLLSNVAIRADEIVRSIAEVTNTSRRGKSSVRA
jgi:L-ornithine N5-monooxygenase